MKTRIAFAAAMTFVFNMSAASTDVFAGQGGKTPDGKFDFDKAPSAPTQSQPRVYFKNLRNRQKLPAEFKVQFGVDGMKVHPAGELIDGTGHHHVVVDGNPIPKGQVVPADEKHIHFGKGQEETILKLAPGIHTLTLQFADGAHVSYGPDLSASIQIEVTGTAPAKAQSKPAAASSATHAH